MQTIRINNFDDLEYKYVEHCLKSVIRSQSYFKMMRGFSESFEFSDNGGITIEYYTRKTKNGFVLDVHKID